MASSTSGTVHNNHIFYTTPVPLVVGILNPPNSPHSLWNCGTGMNYVSMTTIVTGAPISCTIVLEGTLDGTIWSVLATSTSATGDVMFATGLIPFTNLRARCVAIAGGASPTVNVIAVAAQTPIVPNTGGAMPMPTLGAAVQGAGDFTGFGWVVSAGVATAATTLLNATTLTTGTVVDFRTARSNVLFQVVVSGAPTAGKITFYGSADGVTFIPLTSASQYGGTAGAIAQGVLNAFNTVSAFVAPSGSGNSTTALRYFRADVTIALTGGASPAATVLVSAF